MIPDKIKLPWKKWPEEQPKSEMFVVLWRLGHFGMMEALFDGTELRSPRGLLYWVGAWEIVGSAWPILKIHGWRGKNERRPPTPLSLS